MKTVKSHWLVLLRVPNLFTVPGDPLAGFFLAGGAGWRALTGAALAASAAYGAGLIINDVADVETDRRKRPWRPLPAGDLPVAAAKSAAGVLMMVGAVAAAAAGLACLAAYAVLILLICLYNLAAKKSVFGAPVMGLCRGGSVALGWAAAGGDMLLPAIYAGFVFLYITVITVAARRETEYAASPAGVSFLPWLTALPILAAVAAAGYRPAVNAALAAGYAWIFLWSAVGVSTAVKKGRIHVPAAIGEFIRLLLPLQAAAIVVAGQIMLSMIIFSLILPSWLLSRKFHGS